MRWIQMRRVAMVVGCGLCFMAASTQGRAEEDAREASRGQQAEQVAAALLDDSQDAGARERLIEEHAALAGVLVSRMGDVPASDEGEEYRRIPWIWRVAIAAGKRNDESQLRDLLRESLPKPGEPLRDWQAVVIGGGVINGLSLAGHWPAPRIAELLHDDAELSARWKRSLAQAAAMADNKSVRNGTRYDALRMIPLAGWEESGGQLVRYLKQDVDGELQMGAVSGLADIDHPQAAQALIEHWRELNDGNRGMAAAALLRSPARIGALLTAIEERSIAPADLSAGQIKALREHSDSAIRSRAQALLPSQE